MPRAKRLSDYSRIAVAPVKTTRGGRRYVLPIDILRSDLGRETVRRFAQVDLTTPKRIISRPVRKTKVKP